MTPVTQSRVGLDGTCFRACLASILNLKESQVPDFGEEGWMEEANDFLSKHGLRYRRVPVTSTKPDGYSTIEGISPRGGLHACVAKDGELVHDPHPQDGTGRGLVEPRYYGLLEPILGRTKYERERQPDVAPVGDRADMMQLRRNTEKQGGPFFMQVTEPNGREHTIPASKLRKEN